MKRTILLAMVAFMAMLVLAPMAMAQDTTMMMETTMMGAGQMETTMMGGQMTMMEMTGAGQAADADLPESGGPAILLPAAALLVGSGILTYAILRRR